MGKMDGKVAFITGAARGQGRSHAVRLADEGADIIAIDICEDIETVPYPLATPDDLAETIRMVEAKGRRIVAHQTDVRRFGPLKAALDDGVAQLGRVDIILANAGIAPQTVSEVDPTAMFADTLAVNLVGVRNTVHAAVPSMIDQGDGGAIVLTSSTQGLTGRGGTGTGAADGYVASKHAVVGLMRSWANWLAPHSIRVNTVHPTGVSTPMVNNDAIQEYLNQSSHTASALTNLLPVEIIEAADITNAIVWLVSDDARYVTGVALPVDAGFSAK